MRSRELVPCFFAGLLWVLLQSCAGYLPPVLPNEGGAVGGQFLVKVKAGFDVDAVAQEIENLISPGEEGKVHVEIKHIIKKAVPVIVVRLDFSAQDRIRKVPGIEYIEEDGIVKEEDLASNRETDAPNDYGLDRINQREISLDGNVDIKGDGFGANIYLLDTGIRELHRDFECRARNAYDVFGGDGTDDCTGHGSAVAGILAGSSYGVAKRATMHSVKVVGCRSDSGQHHSHAVSNVVIGLDWVLQNKMSPCLVVLALSAGGSRVLDEAVRTLHDAGCVVVAAAGRADEKAVTTGPQWPALRGWSRGSGDPKAPLPPEPQPGEGVGMDDYLHEACRRSPARSPYVLTVAATDSVDTAPSWSNTGLCVDLFAPGQDIYTVNFKNDDDFFFASGTAMATAYVAGAAAVHLANGVMEAPEGVPSQLVNELIRMRILRDASTCCVLDAGEGTPNRLLYLM